MQPAVHGRQEIWRSTQNGFEAPLPADGYRTTMTPNVDVEGLGYFGESSINEKNVAMSATESVYGNPLALAHDPFVEDGLAEDSLQSMVAPFIDSAREGVLYLGKLIKKYGSPEGNGVLFADKDEVWYMEIVTGHHWAATKIPDDAYAIAANQVAQDYIDFNDPQNYLWSEGLQEFVEKYHLNPDKSTFNFRKIFGTDNEKDRHYNTTATTEIYTLSLHDALPIFLSMILVAVVAHPGADINRLLTNPLFTWIGKRSYGIYLYQYPVLVFFEDKVNVADHPFLYGVIEVALILVISDLSYRYLELPLQHFDYSKTWATIKEVFAPESRYGKKRWYLAVPSVIILLALTGAIISPAHGSESKQNSALEKAIESNNKKVATQNKEIQAGKSSQASSAQTASSSSEQAASSSESSSSDSLTQAELTRAQSLQHSLC
ncbi:dipeptidase A [Pediococcus acidilactici D3]|nr:dipeptidase A [Pediococcus acidilactici D3]